jgi:uncharacterized membrane protein
MVEADRVRPYLSRIDGGADAVMGLRKRTVRSLLDAAAAAARWGRDRTAAGAREARGPRARAHAHTRTPALHGGADAVMVLRKRTVHNLLDAAAGGAGGGSSGGSGSSGSSSGSAGAGAGTDAGAGYGPWGAGDGPHTAVTA